MTGSRRLLRLALALAALHLGAAAPARADGLPGTSLYATGSDVFVTFVGFEAQWQSSLFYVYPGAMGLPPQHLFTNKTATPGQSVQVDMDFAPGDEVLFALYVYDPQADQEWWFFTGPGSYNDDGYQHALLTQLGGGSVQVGFEDRWQGGDMDHNDLIFTVQGVTTDPTVVPEPVTMALLGTGLAGVGGAGWIRKRRERRRHDG